MFMTLLFTAFSATWLYYWHLFEESATSVMHTQELEISWFCYGFLEFLSEFIISLGISWFLRMCPNHLWFSDVTCDFGRISTRFLCWISWFHCRVLRSFHDFKGDFFICRNCWNKQLSAVAFMLYIYQCSCLLSVTSDIYTLHTLIMHRPSWEVIVELRDKTTAAHHISCDKKIFYYTKALDADVTVFDVILQYHQLVLVGLYLMVVLLV